MRKQLNSPILFIILVLLLSVSLVSATDVIRPANQMEDRGVGSQIRPANQINLPSDGNGGYTPTQGSHYSSKSDKSDNHEKVDLKANLNPINQAVNNSNESSTNATGTANFVLDKDENTLSYNITYEGLSSNETSATIAKDTDENETDDFVFYLPLGNLKLGIFNYNENQENDFLSGNMYIKIFSLIFPNGELKGQIQLF